MKITTSFDALDSGIAILSGVVSDKMANDSLKNIIFHINPNGTIHLVAYNTIVTCYTELEATVDWGDTAPEETYFQLKSEVSKVLGTYKGLTKTCVSKIEIVPDEINTTLSVFEEPLDTQDVYAEKYRNVTKHRVASPKFPSGIRKELENRNLANEGVVMSSPDIKAYLDTLVATIPADSRDSVGTRIMVKGDTIYTAPQLYFAMMENKLDESFADFVLPTSAANFLKSFLTFEDTVQFSKTQLESVILLKFVNSKSVAFVAALPATNALDCTPHKAHSNTGIVIDKQYFNDLLKRAPSQDACVVDIEICGDGTASGKIMSKTWKQDFVVLKSRLDEKDFEGHSYLTGTGENAKLSLNFSIRAELLKQLIFAQTNIFEDKVFMYFEAAGNTGIRLACRDDTGIWQTKINTLTPKRGEFNWED